MGSMRKLQGFGAVVAIAIGLAPLAAQAQTVVCKASWYGPGFHGHATANGERYNQWGLTAAHKSLPFGTHVTVRYRGHTVIVRINDRGPFVGGRCIDLSKGAASHLGLLTAGSDNVHLDY